MWTAQTIAEAFADCPHDANDMAEDAAIDLGDGGPWLRALARRIKNQLDGDLVGDPASILTAILADKAFQKRFKTTGQDILVPGFIEKPFTPKPVKRRWPELPEVETFVQLAELLKIEPGKLEWLSRCKNNYRRKWIRKRSSGFRLVEAPKPLLKSIQRKILHLVLDYVSPHHCSHGFLAGKSVISFASPHVAQACVLKFDLRGFFPTIRFARVVGLFKAIGYGSDVAKTLALLCTTHCSSGKIDDHRPACSPVQFQSLKHLYLPAHLPQGAPSSPMIANYCAFRLDCRMAGFAAAHDASYTRYADDCAPGNVHLR